MPGLNVGVFSQHLHIPEILSKLKQRFSQSPLNGYEMCNWKSQSKEYAKEWMSNTVYADYGIITTMFLSAKQVTVHRANFKMYSLLKTMKIMMRRGQDAHFASKFETIHAV